MKQEKIFLIVLTVFCLVWGFIGLRMNLAKFESEEEAFFHVAPNSRMNRFFHFSPMEHYALESKKFLWPDLFNSQSPITPAALPMFYKKLMENPRGPEITAYEVLEMRQWSVLANSNQVEALKSMLTDTGMEKPKATFQSILTAGSRRSSEPCSLRAQDRAYRMMQVQVFESEARKFLLACNSESTHSIWFDLQDTKKLTPQKIEQILSQIKNQISGAGAGESFRRWYLLELYNLAHILQTRQSEESDQNSENESKQNGV